MNCNIKVLNEKALSLAKEPGVYIMRNKKDEIIYVGKAKNLKNRVTSYFRALDKHTPKVFAMVENVEDFETIITSSEFEALVLECSLIKLHNPKYNILLKDDKGYSYLKITPKPYSKISEAKQIADDGCKYIGPYMSSWVVRQMADEVNKSFGLPTCGQIFPRDFRKKRPCLNYHLGQCMGVCQGTIPVQEYDQLIARAIETLKGNSAQAVSFIEKEMNKASEELEFEKAARYRDRLRAIERFSQRQRVVYGGVVNQDVIAFVQSESNVSAVVLKFKDERLVDKQEFTFKSDDISQVRNEFLPQYYSEKENIPPVILLDENTDDNELYSQLLSQRLGKKVKITIPQKGENLKLMEMARLNAADIWSVKNTKTGREVAVLDELQRLLNLNTTPIYIESYDISNIGSETIVGAMVVFENGRPKRSAYKKFAMKEIYTPDDYASMAQMLERRLRRLIAQEKNGGSFNITPDLLLIDGGKGHVSTVKGVLSQLGLSIPVFGMVKDDKHRTRAITDAGEEISISSMRQVFTLITRIQDETHRFAVEYARSTHKKTAFESTLTTVEGIGPTRTRELFLHFKTKKAIMAADKSELLAVKGMNARAAENLIAAIQKGEIS